MKHTRRYGTHVVHTFLLYRRVLVRVMLMAQDADSLLRSSFRMRTGMHKFYMKRPWRFAERERCILFAKLQVATVNLHRSLPAAYLFRYLSTYLSQSLLNA